MIYHYYLTFFLLKILKIRNFPYDKYCKLLNIPEIRGIDEIDILKTKNEKRQSEDILIIEIQMF